MARAEVLALITQMLSAFRAGSGSASGMAGTPAEGSSGP